MVGDDVAVSDGSTSDVVMLFGIDRHCRDIMRRRERPRATVEPYPRHDGAEQGIIGEVHLPGQVDTRHLADLPGEVGAASDVIDVVVTHRPDLYLEQAAAWPATELHEMTAEERLVSGDHEQQLLGLRRVERMPGGGDRLQGDADYLSDGVGAEHGYCLQDINLIFSRRNAFR